MYHWVFFFIFASSVWAQSSLGEIAQKLNKLLHVQSTCPSPFPAPTTLCEFVLSHHDELTQNLKHAEPLIYTASSKELKFFNETMQKLRKDLSSSTIPTTNALASVGQRELRRVAGNLMTKSLCKAYNLESGCGGAYASQLAALEEDNFRGTVQALVGRIFVFNSNGQHIASSSGMILPRPLTKSEMIQHDRIVTCSHCAWAEEDDGRPCTFYFVRQQFLNKEGWPVGMQQSQDLCQETLEQWAQDHADAMRQVTHFVPYRPDILNKDITLNKDIELDKRVNNILNQPVSNPQGPPLPSLSTHYASYNADGGEDTGFGFLKKGFILNDIQFLLPIHIKSAHLEKGMLPDQTYYTLGYPSFPLSYGEVAPLYVQTGNMKYFTFLKKSRRIQHETHTAEGMSGGPLLSCKGGSISFWGVVQGGWPPGKNYFTPW